MDSPVNPPRRLAALLALLVAVLSPFFMPNTQAEGSATRIAIAQIFCRDGDREGNFVRIENAIVEAKSQGAQIVTFPESSILGWENPAAHQRAYPIPGKDSDRLCALAEKHGVFLCVGLDEKDGDRLYDSCVLISDQGRLLLKHRKVNVLPELMTPPYCVGSGVGTVDTRFGRIGLLICADSFVKDMLASMAEKKPDIVLIPYGWAAPEGEWPQYGKNLEAVIRNVSKTVGCAVVGTDLVGAVTNGPWLGQVYGGQSAATDRAGNTLVVCRDRDREVRVVSIPAR